MVDGQFSRDRQPISLLKDRSPLRCGLHEAGEQRRVCRLMAAEEAQVADAQQLSEPLHFFTHLRASLLLHHTLRLDDDGDGRAIELQQVLKALCLI
jgi:hypothetical protein